jgi:gluconate 5-dehydrogenase
VAAHPFDLSGRLALVTGGGSGLGFAMAEGLARAGARVVLNGRNRAKLEAAAQRLVAEGHAASICAFDVTDEAAVTAGIGEIEREIAPIDILVNNAAANNRKPLPEYSYAEWRALQAANLDGRSS